MIFRICVIVLAIVAGPVLHDADQQLFIIERTTNGNVVHYDAHLDGNGQLNPREPVVVYWTMGSVNGKRQSLSYLERTQAYGIRVHRTSQDRYVLTVVSQKRLEIEVYAHGNQVRAETTIGGHRAYLHKIFANIDSSFLLPRVNYVELFGTDVITGINCYDKVLPN